MSLSRLVVPLILAWSTHGAAQTVPAPLMDTQPTVSLGVGASMPMGDRAEYDETGFNLVAGVSVRLVEIVSLQTSIAFHRLQLDPVRLLDALELSMEDYEVSGGALSAFTAMGELHIHPFSGTLGFTPYLLAGAGLVRTTRGALEVTYLGATDVLPARSEINFGINLGAGIQLDIREKLGVFAQTTYIIGFKPAENIELLPVQVGISIRFDDF